MRPDASTTRSAARLPAVPRTSSKWTPATRLLSGEAISSVTRARDLISMCGSCSTRWRQMRSSAGRERANWSYPRSRWGKGSKPGSSKRMSRRSRIRMAPASIRSISIPGNIRSSAECPPGSNACVWRACGVPERGAGASGRESRSNTVTFSKCGSIAFAAASPPIPAPTTTACLKIGLRILVAPGSSASHALGCVSNPRRRGSHDADRDDQEAAGLRRQNPSTLVRTVSHSPALHSDGDHTAGAGVGSAGLARAFESRSNAYRPMSKRRRRRVTEIAHRTVEANGIPIHLAEAGSGPLVLLCHGFPESWYSWRHQLNALAGAGYRAIAPDMRGYGRTGQPHEIDQYTLFHLVGDMVGVLDALGAPEAVIVGHDWGAPVAWHCALLRPDRFRAVAALSVPFRPRGSTRPTSVMPQTDSSLFYQLYFQAPGVAEAEFERDPRDTLRRLLYSGSGDAQRESDNTLGDGAPGMVPRTGGFLTRTIDPPALPAWLTEADIDVFAAEFVQAGFRGGLNWYRNIDRNWELLAPFVGAKVTVPALYMAGDRDLVVRFPGADQLIANLKRFVPNLTKTITLPGCGHWTQQERASEVNAALIAFLREVG